MTDKIPSSVLKDCLAKAQNINQIIEYSKDSIVSKTIIDKKAGTITLFSFDKGQGLSEHSTPYDAVIEVIEGRALITIGGTENQVSCGQIIIMPANIPHSVKAQEQFKMLLTMIRS
jgi:quercetin dioxygenase-like cupin family protein